MMKWDDVQGTARRRRGHTEHSCVRVAPAKPGINFKLRSHTIATSKRLRPLLIRSFKRAVIVRKSALQYEFTNARACRHIDLGASSRRKDQVTNIR